jgi:hypothetical protein
MNTQELIEMLMRKYEYAYSICDKAHQFEHTLQVCKTALELNQKFDLGIEERLIVPPALLHDLFTWSRSNHHYLAHSFFTFEPASWLVNNYTQEERELMGLAALEHRASWKGGYSSLLSELIATADRGDPQDVVEMIRRAIQYRRKHNPEMSAEVQVIESLKHLREKFHSETGYAVYPPLYLKVYGESLKKRDNVLLALTPESEEVQTALESLVKKFHHTNVEYVFCQEPGMGLARKFEKDITPQEGTLLGRYERTRPTSIGSVEHPFKDVN